VGYPAIENPASLDRRDNAHLRNFVNAYNVARRLKTSEAYPYEFICRTSRPQRRVHERDDHHLAPFVVG